jgi:hydroxymethylbilane synthase
LFTKELENAMLNREIDLAVHSLKDMPTQLPPELILAATPARTNPGDALISPVYRTLEQLPQGARVGTSSLRRKAQLLYCRPDLQILDLRGNLDTRLNKLDNGNLDAILLAVAGLDRLGWGERITQVLPTDVCLPAVGQGALAIEARSGDQEVLDLLAFLDDPATRQAVTAERSYLTEVEGGCQVPVGVYGQPPDTDGNLILTAVILSVDGRHRVWDAITGPADQAAELGRQLAHRMLAAGGRDILKEVFCQ